MVAMMFTCFTSFHDRYIYIIYRLQRKIGCKWYDLQGTKGRLVSGINYECGKCKNGANNVEDEKYVKLRCVEIVKKFCYLTDLLRKYDSIGKAVTLRIHA